MPDNEQLIRRFSELAIRAQRSGNFVYTSFYSPADAALAYQAAREQEIKLFGGMEGCERNVVRFGDPGDIYDEGSFPVTTLQIQARQEKFAEDLGHRDYLGAILNLGIERDVIGDIIVAEKKAYVFVLDEMADYIIANLERVRHTAVRCIRCEQIPAILKKDPEDVTLTVSSIRLDSIIAKLWHLSRGNAKELFLNDKVFINGRCCRSPEASPGEGDTVTVRGFGRFEFAREAGETKKGKLAVQVRKY